MCDAYKESLPGLCPRPQDFRRNISGVRWPAMKTASDNYHCQRPDASSAHRRPGYPLSGCVPAEPDSVSPGYHTVAARSRDRKYASAPELCLKNPNHFQKVSKSVQKLSEESKFTHTLWRRPVSFEASSTPIVYFSHQCTHDMCSLQVMETRPNMEEWAKRNPCILLVVWALKVKTNVLQESWGTNNQSHLPQKQWRGQPYLPSLIQLELSLKNLPSHQYYPNPMFDLNKHGADCHFHWQVAILHICVPM
jgi:hypothetical protein